MRRLAQPEVLKLATIAALGTALLSGPRLVLWSNRPSPIWYLEAIVFLGSLVLWAFVFAWHEHYTGKPVFTLNIQSGLISSTTLAGLGMAVLLVLFVDPSMRARTPADYPDSYDQWIAMTLFSLVFVQLFLVVAPFAWLVRLIRNQRVAIFLTVCLGVIVLMFKTRSSPTPVPLELFAALFVARITLGFLSVFFYLRGGLLLMWWWGFLLQARHLVHLIGAQ